MTCFREYLDQVQRPAGFHRPRLCLLCQHRYRLVHSVRQRDQVRLERDLAPLIAHRDASVSVIKEPLINSESFSCAGKIPERRTVQIKAPIAGNSQPKAGPMSEAIALGLAKIGNAELAYFNQQMLIHELIRGSLVH